MEVYFDNSATTRVLDKVVAAMDQMMTENYGNPSARHPIIWRSEWLP